MYILQNEAGLHSVKQLLRIKSCYIRQEKTCWKMNVAGHPCNCCVQYLAQMANGMKTICVNCQERAITLLRKLAEAAVPTAVVIYRTWAKQKNKTGRASRKGSGCNKRIKKKSLVINEKIRLGEENQWVCEVGSQRPKCQAFL